MEVISLKRSSDDPHDLCEDTLTAEDWAQLEKIYRLLGPMKEATMRLQGNATHGVYGALWEVLPAMETLLNELETAKENLCGVEASHFKAMVYLAWKKLDEYYTRLDDSYAYVTAVALNPCLKLHWFRRHWAEREDWVTNTEKKVKDAYHEYYKKVSLPRQQAPPQAPRSIAKQQAPSLIDQNLYFSSDEEESACNEPSEWDRFFNTRREKDEKYRNNPLLWWKENHQKYPVLAQMAFDLFGCPAMSSECERLFSKAGHVLSTSRPRLSAGMGEAQLLIASWIKAGIINVDNGEQLLRGIDLDSGLDSDGNDYYHIGDDEVDEE
jgi:hypothetical protein